MKGIELEVFWHTDETRELENIGVDVDLEDGTSKKITFYHIDVITPYDNKYTKIWVGGESFIGTLPYEKTKRLIELEL